MTELYRVIRLAAETGKLNKLVLSKGENGVPKKVWARLCTLRGELTLAFEEMLDGGKVRHRNLPLSELSHETVRGFCAAYAQINLLTALGDVEYRRAKSGKETLLGDKKLVRLLSADYTPFTETISIDREKKHILSGDELFLRSLDITAENGRIHDKKQAKFRQINRFLEHIEEIYPRLPASGDLLVYDLCCGKSYLSFAVYYYLTAIKGRTVDMLGIDLKEDVIAFCNGVAERSGFTGMHFVAGDIRKTPRDRHPHLVVSLHACDIATDIVLDTAARLGACVILSTPCCHRFMNGKIAVPALSFMTEQPFLANKFSETATDALRLLRLAAYGYRVSCAELTDPDDTPKNTLLRAYKRKGFDRGSAEAHAAVARYTDAMRFLVGKTPDEYFAGILSPLEENE